MNDGDDKGHAKATNEGVAVVEVDAKVHANAPGAHHDEGVVVVEVDATEHATAPRAHS